ncbi:MAG: Rieske 2Fe-2S domain-containing protein [Kineosporiaceae bacterium]|jgi:ubiquinol-cytochrome c reductase iron-sulfur subunit
MSERIRPGGGSGNDQASSPVPDHPPVPATGRAVVPATGRTVEPSADRFENPGLPPHQERTTDTDPRAARRAERQVSGLFTLSALGTLTAVAGYVAVRFPDAVPQNMDAYLASVGLSTRIIGLGVAAALLGLGVGAVHWAKTLMPDTERVESRHPMRGTDAERADAVDILAEGAAESGIGRRPLIRNSLLGAAAILPVPALVLLGDLGPLPQENLRTTFWRAGLRLVRDPEGGAVKASDLTIGSAVHVMPEGIDETTDVLEERAKAAVLLLRLDPAQLTDATADDAYQGIVAVSKICTHMGCPVALYEQRTHHLLCPCHQSTFDAADNFAVIFGPAKRPLPRLPITVDDEGYLIARNGFDQPVGPSFWERG